MKPTYSFTEAMNLIMECNSRESVAIMDELIVEEKKGYTLNELKALQIALRVAFNAVWRGPSIGGGLYEDLSITLP